MHFIFGEYTLFPVVFVSMPPLSFLYHADIGVIETEMVRISSIILLLLHDSYAVLIRALCSKRGEEAVYTMGISISILING